MRHLKRIVRKDGTIRYAHTILKIKIGAAPLPQPGHLVFLKTDRWGFPLCVSETPQSRITWKLEQQD